MTREALRDGLVSEQTITDALTSARGDLFIASCYLGVTARELDGYIRSSETIQGFVAAIDRVKRDPEYDRLSNDQFEDQLDRLTKAYRVEALGIIHELATIPMTTELTAAMAEVKLKAAVQLRGANVDNSKNGDQMLVLQELNQLYQQSAPRIKSIRVAQIEFKEGD